MSVKNKWSLKKQILTLYYAFADEHTPWYAKLTSLSALIYLLSPADFIPDIVPFAGYIDDLVAVPFLIKIGTVLLPADVKKAAEQKAAQKNRKLTWMIILAVLALIVLMILTFYAGVGIFSSAKAFFN